MEHLQAWVHHRRHQPDKQLPANLLVNLLKHRRKSPIHLRVRSQKINCHLGWIGSQLSYQALSPRKKPEIIPASASKTQIAIAMQVNRRVTIVQSDLRL